MYNSAFTTKYSGPSNSLRNEVEVWNKNTSLKVWALWDTGATGSCISEAVVNVLGLIPTGKTLIHTPSGSAERNTYLVDVLLPNNVKINDLKVIDAEIGVQGIGILIGMDIITQGDFCVSNYKGKTIFTFGIPSDRKIDFVQEVNLSKIVGPKHGTGKRNKRIKRSKKRKR